MNVQGEIVPGRWDCKTQTHNTGGNPEWHWLGCGVKYFLIWTPNSGLKPKASEDMELAEAVNQLSHLTTATLGT